MIPIWVAWAVFLLVIAELLVMFYLALNPVAGWVDTRLYPPGNE